MRLVHRFHQIGFFLLLSCIHWHSYGAPQSAPGHPDRKAEDQKYIERGRYLVKVAGCNDCHTPNYPQSGGNVPEKQWLIGDQLGWRGPWGTTYPANLRKYMHGITEEEWLKIAPSRQMRPPMPWFALRDMTKDDLRAIYRFVQYLGPDNNAVPAYAAPNQSPTGPFVQFPLPPK